MDIAKKVQGKKIRWKTLEQIVHQNQIDQKLKISLTKTLKFSLKWAKLKTACQKTTQKTILSEFQANFPKKNINEQLEDMQEKLLLFAFARLFAIT